MGPITILSIVFCSIFASILLFTIFYYVIKKCIKPVDIPWEEEDEQSTTLPTTEVSQILQPERQRGNNVGQQNEPLQQVIQRGNNVGQQNEPLQPEGQRGDNMGQQNAPLQPEGQRGDNVGRRQNEPNIAENGRDDINNNIDNDNNNIINAGTDENQPPDLEVEIGYPLVQESRSNEEQEELNNQIAESDNKKLEIQNNNINNEANGDNIINIMTDENKYSEVEEKIEYLADQKSNSNEEQKKEEEKIIEIKNKEIKNENVENVEQIENQVKSKKNNGKVIKEERKTKNPMKSTNNNGKGKKKEDRNTKTKSNPMKRKNKNRRRIKNADTNRNSKHNQQNSNLLAESNNKWGWKKTLRQYQPRDFKEIDTTFKVKNLADSDRVKKSILKLN